jgi:DNA-binding NarL/FixJ family response regulator
MPGMNGFELARAIRDHNPNMKIPLLTAFDIDKSEFEKIFPSTTIDGLFTKPVGISTLVDTINAVLTSKC